jgi:ABC-type Fe3+/spermidine/putrescine transport system ATPase subunit
MTTALVCAGIHKSLGGKPVLRDLDLTVGAGEIVSLLGASGSGKTTLLRLIAGLHDPDAGTIAIGGRPVWANGSGIPAENRRAGMVFQDYALWPHMTVAQNLAFGVEALRLASGAARNRIAQALEATRLTALAQRYPNELSGGQQQRVAIARCLAAQPALMLFDEPLSNLDAALREDMRTEMIDIVRNAGATLIYVTHDQADAMAVSDRIAVMRDGVIAQLDTPTTIYDQPADKFVAAFIGGFSLLPGERQAEAFRLAGSDTVVQTTDRRSGSGLLIVRPEDARPAGMFPRSRLSGEVVSCAYLGRCWRLGIRINGVRVRIDWPEHAPAGSMLTFSIAPDRCTILDA